MLKQTQQAAAVRLARIEGQVRGVARMVQQDRYCIEVVQQIQAVKSALRSLEAVILDDHVRTCVESALQGNNLSERRAKVEELVSVLGQEKR